MAEVSYAEIMQGAPIGSLARSVCHPMASVVTMTPSSSNILKLGNHRECVGLVLDYAWACPSADHVDGAFGGGLIKRGPQRFPHAHTLSS